MPLLRSLALALDCSRQRLIKGSFGFRVFVVRNLCLRVFHLELEELFFQSIEQHARSFGARDGWNWMRGTGTVGDVDSSRHEDGPEAAEKVPPVLIERIRCLDGCAKASAGTRVCRSRCLSARAG